MGIGSWYIVQYKFSNHPKVITVDNDHYAGLWSRAIAIVQNFFLNRAGSLKGVWRFTKALDWLAKPGAMFRHQLGIEEFNFRGSRQLLRRLPVKPDIIHGHVLHGGFFDLRYIGKLSREIPVFLTLHDAWLLAGHCVHSFDCERWKTGCGKCPDLTIPMALKRDGSSINWKRKNRIYSKSKLYVATPCHWLMNKVRQSMLNQACVDMRVIPNGVNQEIFYPGDKTTSRNTLGLETSAFIFLFSANGIRRNRWKDFELMKKALEVVSMQKHHGKVIFLALGDKADPILMGDAEVRFIPYTLHAWEVANYYRAADVYLHAARADTFPNAVLEALSCGIPVIATAVGGIPEQVKGWGGAGFLTTTYNTHDVAEATGILVEAGNAHLFARAMEMLMHDENIRLQLGTNAARDAKQRFSLEKMVQNYLDWYKEILAKHQMNHERYTVGMA
jgi:glycosyltransferase involved in cell wall biosynthesis